MLVNVVPRRDARDIVTGKTNFARDRKMLDMLYGRVLWSPHPHENYFQVAPLSDFSCFSSNDADYLILPSASNTLSGVNG